MKVLVYGFKSYKRWKKNITEQVLDALPEGKYIVKTVFAQKLNKREYIKKIKETNPDVIIGLGQHEAGEMFRIERKAVNILRKNSNSQPSIIFKDKPHHHFLSFIIEQDEESWHCYDAGDGVSNYSMYIISHFFKNIPFAFIHIPKDMSVEKAADFVGNKILGYANNHLLEGEQSGLSGFFKRKKEENQKLILQ